MDIPNKGEFSNIIWWNRNLWFPSEQLLNRTEAKEHSGIQLSKTPGRQRINRVDSGVPGVPVRELQKQDSSGPYLHSQQFPGPRAQGHYHGRSAR